VKIARTAKEFQEHRPVRAERVSIYCILSNKLNSKN